MREQGPVGSWHGLDAATFDAAVERVVARVVAAPADDTAGARVVARLRAAPSWQTAVPRLMLAPAAALLAVAMVVVMQRGPSSDGMAGPIRPESAAAIAATQAAPVPAAPAAAADAGDTGRAARLLLIGATPGALSAGARRRSRARDSAPPVDDGTALPLIDTPVIGVEALSAAGDRGPAPAPLPVDALVLTPLEASDLDRDQ